MRDNPDEEAKPLIDCLPKRCPMCGRDVPSFFEHIDVECMDWPDEPSHDASVDYRGWEIGYDDGYGFNTKEPWSAYKGGVDLDAPRLSAATFVALCAEIDGEEGD